MSRVVYQDRELRVGSFCGPAGPSDRRRWAIDTGEGTAELDRAAVIALACALLIDASPELADAARLGLDLYEQADA